MIGLDTPGLAQDFPTYHTANSGLRGHANEGTYARYAGGESATTDCRFKPRCYTIKVLLSTNQVFGHFPIAVRLSTKIGGKAAIGGGTPGRITKITCPVEKQ